MQATGEATVPGTVHDTGQSTSCRAAVWAWPGPTSGLNRVKRVLRGSALPDVVVPVTALAEAPLP